MRSVTLESVNDFAEWRGRARALLAGGIAPEDIVWRDPTMGAQLFAMPDDGLSDAGLPAVSRPVGGVPPAFLELAETAICHSDPDRFDLLYRVLWRLQEDRGLIAVASDPDIARLNGLVRSVRRDSHKMTAFVRFRQLTDAAGGERYLAWFEPDHFILERTAPFFQRRFTSMVWGIVTPYRSVFWDGEALSFRDGGVKGDVPADDAMEEAWRTYFASIFNPARLKVRMMKAEMPVRYWRNLPEAELIPSLIAGARKAEDKMISNHASEPSTRHMRQKARMPDGEAADDATISSLTEARSAVHNCRRCPLYEHATQAVFGEGPDNAQIMVVGEQPGDQEDLAGKPFVGPAGQVLDAALVEAGIAREKLYVTNAVKHFKFEPRGKRRIHAKPNTGEIKACRFWLDLERRYVTPSIIVAMGATAVQGVLGKAASITSLRDAPVELEDGTMVFVTVHPSYLLRLPDRTLAARERARFVEDLSRVAQFARGLKKSA